jgi:hypothetical protein
MKLTKVNRHVRKVSPLPDSPGGWDEVICLPKAIPFYRTDEVLQWRVTQIHIYTSGHRTVTLPLALPDPNPKVELGIGKAADGEMESGGDFGETSLRVPVIHGSVQTRIWRMLRNWEGPEECEGGRVWEEWMGG